jgi:hypothetical protein
VATGFASKSDGESWNARERQASHAQGRSVRELILAGAKSTLVEGKRPRPKRVRFPLIVSKGPKVDLTNEHIYEYVEFP